MPSRRSMGNHHPSAASGRRVRRDRYPRQGALLQGDLATVVHRVADRRPHLEAPVEWPARDGHAEVCVGHAGHARPELRVGLEQGLLGLLPRRGHWRRRGREVSPRRLLDRRPFEPAPEDVRPSVDVQHHFPDRMARGNGARRPPLPLKPVEHLLEGRAVPSSHHERQ